MVEDVKRFYPELHFLCLGDFRILQQCKIRVIQARTNEEPAHRITDLPQWFLHEITWIEVWVTVTRIAIHVQFAAIVGIAWYIYRG